MKTITLCLTAPYGVLFRAWGEYDPTARGAYSFARSFQLPTPSTVAGLICNLLTSRKPLPPPPPKNWIGEYMHVLKECGIKYLRGPFLMSKKDIYVPLGGRDMLGYRLVRINDAIDFVRELCRCIEKLKNEKNLKKIEEELERMEKTLGRVEKIKHLVPIVKPRTGVGLNIRVSGIKSAKEGLIYTCSRIVGFKDGSSEEPLEEWKIAIEICVEKPEVIPESFVSRLGGDATVVIGEVLDRCPLEEHIRRQAQSGEDLLLLLISPLIVEPGGTQEGKSLVRLIWGSMSVLGMGFSGLWHRRRPIEHVITPGSVLALEGGIAPGLLELYRTPEDFLSRLTVSPIPRWYSIKKPQFAIGYGTFLPFTAS